MDFKDDYIVEATYFLIRFLNIFLEMRRMLTKKVFTLDKSTLKDGTYNLNHET